MSFNGFKPEPRLTVSEWADQHRILSQVGSSEPGKFRTSRTPYLKAIMDALSPSSSVEKVIFMKGAQIGGTEAGNNWVGFVIDQAPGPMLVVQPTVEMGKRWSKGRLAPLIEDSPKLKDKVKSPRSRDSGNTLQSKEFPGGQIVITGSNSAVGLRSMPVRYLFLDEVDAYPGDAGGEGDPISLATQRTVTFSRRKIFMVSTPTIQGASCIEKEFNASNKQYYYVPCPHCAHYQVLKWTQIKWDEDPKQAYYECVSCNKGIIHQHKTTMLAQGEWRAENPEITQIAGFHLSSLYSPWTSWGKTVVSFLMAKNDPKRLQAWTNTTLGETWQDKGEAPDWVRLFERRESYPQGVVPFGGLVITSGVDVQKDRLECQIVAWGQNKQSWGVDYIVIDGDPGTAKPWQKLTEILNTPIPGADGIDRPISMMAIDAGFATQEVYAWVRQQPSNKVMAVKGVDKALVPLGSPSKVDTMINGHKMKRGAKLWPVGVSILKSELYHALNLTQDENGYPKGYCHFPQYEPEFFKQITAEQLITKTHKGYAKREWVKMRDRNEALDTRIYARAAAIALGLDRWGDAQWEVMGGKAAPKIPPKAYQSAWLKDSTPEPNHPPSPIPQPQKRKSLILTEQSRRRVIRSSWMDQ